LTRHVFKANQTLNQHTTIHHLSASSLRDEPSCDTRATAPNWS
jgi:hypothetical protein